jgi:hypothetical protein
MEEFKLTKLSRRVSIVEAIAGDIHGWGNDEENRPAFLAYLGCESTKEGFKARQTVEYVCDGEAELRSRRNTRSGFPYELKIRGLTRNGLEDLLSVADQLEDMKLYSA